MNCSEAERLFDAHLDAELSGSLRLEFDAHRLRCRFCQRKLAMLETCEHVLASHSRAPRLSADFTDSVMAAVAASAPPARPFTLFRSRGLYAGGLAAAAVIAAVWLAPLWRGGASGGAALASNDRWLHEVQAAQNDKDRVRLMQLFADRAESMRVAKAQISNDVGLLSNFARSLSASREFVEASGNNPLDMLLSLFGATPAGAADGHDADTYSF
jgi:hypothetical protein